MNLQSKNFLFGRIVLFVALLLGSCLSAFAQPFAGSGTQADPWLITDADELYLLRNYRNSTYYFRLENDIDLTEFITENFPETGWPPIGSKGTEFCGNFNGNGHTISGLYINSTSDYVGLFGGFKGIIRNLKVKGNVTGRDYIGGIAGIGSAYSSSTTTGIYGSRFDGTVTGRSYVGGLCGELKDANYSRYCSIGTSGFKGVITASNNYVGGICGNFIGHSINTCWTWGKIKGNMYVAGICGYGETRVIDCYARCDIEASSSSAGIAGWIHGVFYGYSIMLDYCGVYRCQYVGKLNVTGGSSTAGIVDDVRGSKVTQNISRGTLSINGTQNRVGGIVGATMLRNIINKTYVYNTITSNVAINDVVEATNNWTVPTGKGAARIVACATTNHTIGAEGTAEANLALSTTQITFGGNPVDVSDYEHHGTGTTRSFLKKQLCYTAINWDFDNVWAIDATLNDGYPYQQSLESIIREMAEDDAKGLSLDVNVGDTHYATYYNSYASVLPADVKAAIVTGVDGHTLQLNWLYDGADASKNTIPGGTPVILQGSETGLKTLTYDKFNYSAAPSGNLLCGSDEALTDSETGYYYFVLSLNSALDPTSVGFYFQSGTDGEYVDNGGHKAYLKLKKTDFPSLVGGFTLADGGLTGITGPIDNGEWRMDNYDNSIYSLDGRRVSHHAPLTSGGERGGFLPKGIYIQNGKKVVVK